MSDWLARRARAPAFAEQEPPMERSGVLRERADNRGVNPAGGISSQERALKSLRYESNTDSRCLTGASGCRAHRTLRLLVRALVLNDAASRDAIRSRSGARFDVASWGSRGGRRSLYLAPLRTARGAFFGIDILPQKHAHAWATDLQNFLCGKW